MSFSRARDDLPYSKTVDGFEKSIGENGNGVPVANYTDLDSANAAFDAIRNEPIDKPREYGSPIGTLICIDSFELISYKVDDDGDEDYNESLNRFDRIPTEEQFDRWFRGCGDDR